MTEILKRFEDFLKETDLTKEEVAKGYITFIDLRNEFLKEYPIEIFQSISLDDYCLGTQKSKDSLSYNLEFGKYKHLSLGIGGGTAGKFGIYYSSNDEFYKDSKGKKIDNPIKYWEEFRNQLFSFLINIDKIEDYNFENDFPLLVGKKGVRT